jgi:protein-tyrosine phosphatase
MFPGYSAAPYCSPIRVHTVTPLKRGDGSFTLEFWNAFYAEGVQSMTYQLRTLRRTPDYLVAEVLGQDRTVTISLLTDEWAHRFGRGYTAGLLKRELGSPEPPLAIDCVDDHHLYVGPFPKEAHVDYLQQLGIQGVLSVVDDQDPERVCDRIRECFEWAQLPVRDSYWKGVPTVDDLADAVAVLREWRAKGLKRFYIHCLAGQGRSPLMAMAYMVNGARGTNGMRLTKAIAHVTNRRPEADPNVHQLRVLADYVERSLHVPEYHPERYQASTRVIRR